MKCFLVRKTVPPYNLRLVKPAYNDPSRLEHPHTKDMTDDEFLADCIARHGDDRVDMSEVYICEEEDVPDLYWIKAWEWNGACEVNRAKAEEVHMAWIRTARDRDLAALDGPMMGAKETGNQGEEARIIALKQTLRDIPQTVNLAQYATLDELQASWPSELSHRLPPEE